MIFHYSVLIINRSWTSTPALWTSILPPSAVVSPTLLTLILQLSIATITTPSVNSTTERTSLLVTEKLPNIFSRLAGALMIPTVSSCGSTGSTSYPAGQEKYPGEKTPQERAQHCLTNGRSTSERLCPPGRWLTTTGRSSRAM